MRFFVIASVLFTAALSVFASPVAKRETQSAAGILTDLINTATPLANQLLYATPENATQANLTPIIGGINTAVTNAVGSLNGLAGQSASVILASADGTTILAASEIASLLAAIVNLVLTAVGAILRVVDSTFYTLIYELCVDLGKILCSLISILIHLIDGLIPLLVSLLAPVLSILSKLGLLGLLSEILGGLL